MSECVFIQAGAGQVQCLRSGWSYHTRSAPERITRNCPHPLTCFPPPTRANLVAQFLRELAAHRQAGSPRAEAHEVRQRLATCRGCDLRVPHFGSERLSTCAPCGCLLAVKARWADQHCPFGLWPGDPPGGGCVACPGA